MPNLEAIVGLNNFDILYTPDQEITAIRRGLNKAFISLYREGMKAG